MIRVVDYGVGNIQAFLNMFKRLGLPAERAKAADDLADATRLILPGVGSFDHAMTLLNQSGLREPLEARVVEMAKRMGEIASAVGAGGALVIHAALEGLEDVRLSAQDRSGKRLRTPFVHLGTIDMPSLSLISVENLRQILDAIWLAAGFSDGSPLYGDGISDDLRESMLVAPEVISRRA